MPAPSTDVILSDLRRHGLLSTVEWSELHVGSATGGSADRLGQTLTDRGWLTRYQVEVALRGQTSRLIFGPYLLLDRVAEGGMGVVYRARHSRLGRTVALKVIRHDKLKSKVVARRFLREIRLTASLEHPHIVRAYDAGVVGDQLYLATEFIFGRDLGTVVRQSGPLAPAEACLAVYRTALALQHIHERSMIHRDLKPSNLIRDDNTGAVKLLDLGLCGVPHEGGAFDSQSGTITRNGVLLGTPDYIAPEQAQNPHEVDIRADLYSLGCTFFYLLTGRPPFAGGGAIEKLIRHLHEPPPRILLPHGEVLPALAAIIAQLMAKRPDHRFPNPQSVAEALLELRPKSSLCLETPPPTDSPTADFGEFAAIQTGRKGTENAPTPKPAVLKRSWALLAVGIGICIFSLALLIAAIAVISSRPESVPEEPASSNKARLSPASPSGSSVAPKKARSARE